MWRREQRSWTDDHGIFHQESDDWEEVDETQPERMIDRLATLAVQGVLIVAIVYLFAALLAMSWCRT